jgi:predicted permease
MEILSRIRSLFRAVFHRNLMEDDMRNELQFHLDAYAGDLMAKRGLSREEAMRQARIKFGSIDKCAEAAREARGLRFVDVFRQNAQYAFRQFLQNPGFMLTAVLTLALGIGANTAIYSIHYMVMQRPLNVSQPEQLVNLSAPGPKSGMSTTSVAGGVDDVFSYPLFRDLEKDQAVFTGIAAHTEFAANITDRGKTWSVSGAFVSGSYFPVLGVRAVLGRLLSPEDDRIIGEPHIVVLSYAYWQTRFGGDPNILNQTLIINRQPMTVVGVVQREFGGTVFLEKSKIFVPITMRGLLQPGFNGFGNRLDHWAYLFARLKPGITPEQAQTSLNSSYHAIINEVEAPLQIGLSEQNMAWFKTKMIILNKGARGQIPFGDLEEKQIRLIFGITILVWIIACLNVANLFLARGAARRDEIAVRLSIGASRTQVVAQLLTESCLLALFAGAAAIPVARLTLNLITSILPFDMYEIFQFSLNTPVLIFAAVLTLGTGVFFGLFPALHCTRSDVASSLKLQTGRQSGARSATRFRTSLSTVQIALSLTLLIVAGLFAKSLYSLNHIDLGLKVDNVVTFSISPSRNDYTLKRTHQLYEQLEDEIAALPGVTSVTNSTIPILNGISWGREASVEGYAMGPDTDASVLVDWIGPSYFHTLGIPLISGREFRRTDNIGSPRVAIVNEAFAGKFHLGRNVVGKHIGYRNGPLDTEIVGLVKNAKYAYVAAEIPPLVFRPYRQESIPWDLTFYVKSSLESDLLMQRIARLAARLDSNLPVERLNSMSQQMRENYWADRAGSILTMAFACLAILLTAVGLYGVLSYTVTQRTREIGLRIALGASRARVRAMVFFQVGFMTLIGCVAGLGLAAELSRWMKSFIYFYQFEVLDPGVFYGSTVIIILVTLFAGCIPAYRASKVDPMQALWYE